MELSRSLDAGFATPVFHWAEGKPLEDVLEETEMAPGRLRPELQAARSTCSIRSRTSRTARRRRSSEQRARSVMHGVVAYTGV